MNISLKDKVFLVYDVFVDLLKKKCNIINNNILPTLEFNLKIYKNKLINKSLYFYIILRFNCKKGKYITMQV